MDMIQIIGFLADTIAIGGIFVTLWQVRRMKQEADRSREEQRNAWIRMNTPVTIILKDEGAKQSIVLPGTLRREKFLRAEVNGLLGSIPRKELGQYSLGYTTTYDYLQAIDALHVGNGDRLEIPCGIDHNGAREIEQFDMARMRKLGFRLSGFE